MGYRQQLDKAAQWLETIQNPDDGWGRTAGLASSIVNSAEAVYVLHCSSPQRYGDALSRGFGFIQRVTAKSLQKQPRTRYALFALAAVLVDRQAFPDAFVEEVMAWVFQAQNPDGGWGHQAKDGSSRLFPTVMSVLTLAGLGQRDRLQTAHNWIASNQTSGWTFAPGQAPNPVSTSMAVLALRRFREPDDPRFDLAKSDLLTVDSWGNATEDLPGADWVHSAHMWGFAALTSLGYEPYVKPIAQGVRQLNELRCDQGWREPDGHLTVRGQYWTVMAFEALQTAFDPAVHVYRIDTARLHSFALEPEFAVLQPHTAWTIVVREIVKCCGSPRALGGVLLHL